MTQADEGRPAAPQPRYTVDSAFDSLVRTVLWLADTIPERLEQLQMTMDDLRAQNTRIETGVNAILPEIQSEVADLKAANERILLQVQAATDLEALKTQVTAEVSKQSASADKIEAGLAALKGDNTPSPAPAPAPAPTPPAPAP
jgi:hypothetical protein